MVIPWCQKTDNHIILFLINDVDLTYYSKVDVTLDYMLYEEDGLESSISCYIEYYLFDSDNPLTLSSDVMNNWVNKMIIFDILLLT